ncbi:hypothetical protein QUF72_18190 [Desulfobacterales bacterium HSG2]|nr:hypothetical protein [Desulfobacterales bacterium HSG2]
MNKYGVISFIHEILYETPEEILDRAEEISQQPQEVLKVIKALKDARVAIADKRRTKQKKPRADVDNTSWSASASKLWNNIKTSIANAKRGITNKAVVDAFIQAGLDTKARSKDSKKKILSTIKASLDIIEDAKRTEVLSDVLGRLELDQTKGWMKVIKSGKQHYKHL